MTPGFVRIFLNFRAIVRKSGRNCGAYLITVALGLPFWEN
jgi:hypothetical protein